MEQILFMKYRPEYQLENNEFQTHSLLEYFHVA